MTMQLRTNADDLIDLETTVPAVPQETLRVKGGIARGTIILTMRGEVVVEDLTVGDRLITRERGSSTLQAIKTFTQDAVTIRTDSLGLGRPERDTTIAADQHVTLRDWRAEALFGADAALVPAVRLADGKQVAAFGEAEFFQLDLGAALTVYANGLETTTGRTETGVIEIPAE